MGSIISLLLGHTEISPDQVQRLCDGVKVTTDGSVNIPSESLQELLAICSKWKDKGKTIHLTSEVIGTLLNGFKDKLPSIPISTSSESTSIPTAERIEAEPPSDTPAQAKPKTPVEVVNPLPSGANKNFLSALSNKMEQHNMSFVDCTVQQLNEDETNNKLVLVVCNNHSRLLTDIQSTLTVINSARYERIILLVVHCQKEKHLPALTALSQLRDTPDFKKLHGVLDMAFDGVHGIYDCDMNKRAFDVFQEKLSNGLFSDTKDRENDESQRKKMKQKDERNQQKETR